MIKYSTYSLIARRYTNIVVCFFFLGGGRGEGLGVVKSKNQSASMLAFVISFLVCLC